MAPYGQCERRSRTVGVISEISKCQLTNFYLTISQNTTRKGHFAFFSMWLFPRTFCLTTFATDIHRLNVGVPDLQTRATLFRFCARPTIDHLLSADFLNTASNLNPSDPTHFVSDFTQSIDISTQSFVKRLTAYTPTSPTADHILPEHSTSLLYLPAAQGGFGFRSPYVSATASFVLSIAKTLRLAQHGIRAPSCDSPIHLPMGIRTLLHTWPTSNARLFTLFHHYG